MNTQEIGTLAPLPPPHRPATACDLHPGETVTGFCASCLRERLAGLDSAAAAAAPGRRSTSALKSFFFFKPSAAAAAAAAGVGAQPPSSSSSSFLRPELRRCKSFSCGRGGGDGLAGGTRSAAFEPQRRSCDVRGRSTLWSLFNQDDRDRFRSGGAAPEPFLPASSATAAAAAAIGGEIEAERPSLGFPPPCVCVLEAREEEDEERDAADEITPADPVLVIGTSGEVGGEANAVAAEEQEAKPMKEHMDLESNPSKRTSPKDLKEIAGSFWLAASVFSKKWQQWRRKQKQKLKKQGAGAGGGGGVGGSTSKAAAAAMPPPERPPRSSLRGRRRRFLDTQSEVAADASARRSCDTDPRFSLDAGLVSFDDPRFSWDEPRASWDGHLLGGGGGGGGGAGGRSLFTRLPPILSVVEDAPAPAPAHVQRSDGQIPVEEDSAAPGGSAQTRDYYESTDRKRRSFERSMSLRKPPPPEVNDDPEPATNAKVSPAGGAEFYHLHHASSILDRDFRDFSSSSLHDDISESFESAFRDPHKGARAKKSNRWSKAWSIWGFIHRRGSRAEEAAMNGVERSFSESWPELRMRGYDGKILRSNSSLSARSSFSGGYGSMRRSNVEINGNGMKKKKRREEFILERNRSARYSPSRVDNGMLRFYLTPMRSGSSRRNGMVGNGRHVGSNSFARSMLRLY